jgi:hypothetical protein
MRRRPYVLGLVILIHLLLLALLFSSPDPERGPLRPAAVLAARELGVPPSSPSVPASPALATAAQDPARGRFGLSFDHVGIVGASSFPPPAKPQSSAIRPGN